ncbi:hypothetical protein C0Q70_06827 [Pomacea canaliculata]|uniref:Methyltransferase type 11 domain-containing protein n=1 Tax=Pomacea canaliculata TaxID=400727 RepID=A0A2T7PDB8_POMCA|nr:hypothetical protein C0Q70_06827 [Pomacea canaliculata]
MPRNKLKLNDEKTEAMLCGSKLSLSKVSLDSTQVGQARIPLSSSVRNLGLYVDNLLTMSDHVSSVVKACYFHIRTLGRLRPILNKKTANAVAVSLICDIAFRFLQFIESQSTSSSDSQHINSPFTNSERETGTPVSTSSTDTTDESPSSSSDDESSISWVQGNAESLPFPDASFDAYTIAFGIRNCTNVQKVLDEAYRVLRRVGRFMCLEFSQVTNPVLRSLYDSYSFQVIPVMGQVIAND